VDRAAALLVGCVSVRRASELHAVAVRAGVDQDKAVDFRPQRAYAAPGWMDLAVALLRCTADLTAVFYTSAIHAHSSRGLHQAALALLSEMLLSHGLLPTAHTLSASLPACGGLALHGYAVKLALSDEPYALHGYAVKLRGKKKRPAGSRRRAPRRPTAKHRREPRPGTGVARSARPDADAASNRRTHAARSAA